ncbi:hypothetical protein FHR81_003402 [Actinoalloteichus hoggarensis]|uniref:Uncharacterized protein n=1 Tax=Actinoalloteichus hoggarensis TaxID=1470176 RepID=A0A221W7R9_9PSEU|nr:hypothetical protein [Actinoalloteichus hoggarensis]ASO21753.1 hypothetical protein AHOG_20680 [Actinoalloteichus hoggarensis]MBB5922350.1 hypothetical protein [Actinoalloteichus hoggarensis]
MLRTTVQDATGSPVVLVDSVSSLSVDDRGAVAVTGSHGGSSSAEWGTRFLPGLIFFNDAGMGKDRAGAAALDLLDAAETACAVVDNDTARIGDADDTWHHGVVSSVNRAAAARGVAAGQTVRDATAAWHTSGVIAGR